MYHNSMWRRRQRCRTTSSLCYLVYMPAPARRSRKDSFTEPPPPRGCRSVLPVKTLMRLSREVLHAAPSKHQRLRRRNVRAKLVQRREAAAPCGGDSHAWIKDVSQRDVSRPYFYSHFCISCASRPDERLSRISLTKH